MEGVMQSEIEKFMRQLDLALRDAKVKPEKATRVMELVEFGLDDEKADTQPPVFPGEDIQPDPREISVKIPVAFARSIPDHAGPQPAPTTGGPDVLDALLEDYKARAEMGLKKYGVRLQAFNGRRALVDALQEAMDLSLYLKQALMEEDAQEDWEREERGSER